MAPRDGGFSAPAIRAPGACTAGEALSWDPADGASIEVFGLPMASAEGGTIRWTPPHGGVWGAVVVARTGDGWSFAVHRLACGR